jgi:hypothetical protein
MRLRWRQSAKPPPRTIFVRRFTTATITIAIITTGTITIAIIVTVGGATAIAIAVGDEDTRPNQESREKLVSLRLTAFSRPKRRLPKADIEPCLNNVR